jgi:hypothetical protein
MQGFIYNGSVLRQIAISGLFHKESTPGLTSNQHNTQHNRYSGEDAQRPPLEEFAYEKAVSWTVS